MLRLLCALYRVCVAFLAFGGSIFGEISIASGIQQGCPLSGSIFALAVDPSCATLPSA